MLRVDDGNQTGNQTIVIAKFNYEPTRDDELEIYKGQRIIVLQQSEDAWWRGRNEESSSEGWFPSNYVDMVSVIKLSKFEKICFFNKASDYIRCRRRT